MHKFLLTLFFFSRDKHNGGKKRFVIFFLHNIKNTKCLLLLFLPISANFLVAIEAIVFKYITVPLLFWCLCNFLALSVNMG